MIQQLDTPNFSTWQHDTLAKFAAEVYAKLQAEQAANEQLRLDLKDAMMMARKQILEDNRV
jgi:hypothetical protein